MIYWVLWEIFSEMLLQVSPLLQVQREDIGPNYGCVYHNAIWTWSPSIRRTHVSKFMMMIIIIIVMICMNTFMYICTYKNTLGPFGQLILATSTSVYWTIETLVVVHSPSGDLSKEPQKAWPRIGSMNNCRAQKSRTLCKIRGKQLQDPQNKHISSIHPFKLAIHSCW